MSQTPWKIGKFEVKIEEKALAGANRKGRIFASGHAVRREELLGTSESLKILQVNFDNGKGARGGNFWSV